MTLGVLRSTISRRCLILSKSSHKFQYL